MKCTNLKTITLPKNNNTNERKDNDYIDKVIPKSKSHSQSGTLINNMLFGHQVANQDRHFTYF